MPLYKLNMPARVYFGRNILEASLRAEASLLSGTVLVVTTGRSLVRLGHLERLCGLLKSACHAESVAVFDAIHANPLVSDVEAAIAYGRQHKPSVVIGFGGGSALDAAKAAAAGIGMGCSCRMLFDGMTFPSAATLPVVAIPTTAGTGSELSKAAILTDKDRNIKTGIRGEYLYPAAAIVDSFFTETVPLRTSMETGFDVLAHAMESYLSRLASPYTRMLSETAASIAGRSLPLLAADLGNTDARADMSYASMIMGINLGNASTCLPHRMQYPIGAHSDTSHGAGLAALYPAWLHYEAGTSWQDLQRLLKIIGCPQCSGQEEAIAWFRNFLAGLGLPANLRELGLDEGLVAQLPSEVTGNLQNDPAAAQEDVVRKIYQKALF